MAKFMVNCKRQKDGGGVVTSFFEIVEAASDSAAEKIAEEKISKEYPGERTWVSSAFPAP